MTAMPFLSRCLSAAVLLTVVGTGIAADLANTLKDHPAPYLALHGNDPVAWQSWDEDTIETARKENKILYLSIGYFSCHWCHVMQKESYQNAEIADFLNRHFIPVKIDRELEPALDRELMNFTQRIIGRGGWPLNVFITPDGYPIYSVLYSPADQFLQLLNKLQAVWDRDPETVRSLVSKEVITEFPDAGPERDADRFNELLENAVEDIMLKADTINGGFGNSQKFPSVPQLRYLIRNYQRKKNDEVKAFVSLTLEAMAAGGLQDHVTGGFFRYTTDPGWNIPHFEKMLYDNVNMALLYLDAGMVFDMPEYVEISNRTFSFLREFMWHENGAFVSSFSAVDDKNMEGGSYLWTRRQISEALEPDQARLILAVWNLDREPELPAGNHPRFVMSLSGFADENGLGRAEVEAMYRQSIDSLRRIRNARSPPVDDKLLAGWNGLALSAFTAAAKASPDLDFHNTARSLQAFLSEKLWDGKSLSRSMTKGKLLGVSSLEDYAYVGRGLLDWAVYADSDDALETAYRITRQAWAKFHRGNVWYQGDQTLLAAASGEAVLSDAANPSPSATLISTTLRLAEIRRDAELEKLALSALNRGESYLSRAPFWYVSQLAAIQSSLRR